MEKGKSGELIWKSGSFDVRVTWSEEYDILTNMSNLIIGPIEVKSDTYSKYDYYPNGTISIKKNGKDQEVVTNFISAIPTHHVYWSTKNTYKAIEWDASDEIYVANILDIEHESNGSKKIDIELSLAFYTYDGKGGSGWRISDTQSIELTTIPRSSSVSLSNNSVDVGRYLGVNIAMASPDFTNNIELYIDESDIDNYIVKYDAQDGLHELHIPYAWYAYFETSMSRSAYCMVTTYNGDVQVGNPVITPFTVNVPPGTAPEITNVSIDVSDITTSDGNTHNVLVKGKNQITVTTYCKSSPGSPTISYKFEVIYNSSVIATKEIVSSLNNTSATFGPFSQVGELEFKVTATDTRLQSHSYDDLQHTIECHNYYLPFFKSFNAYRSNSDGTANVNGKYLCCLYDTDYASVDDTNDVNVIIKYNNEESSVIPIDLNGDTDTTYKVYAEISDLYGGESTSSIITVFGQSRILNITPDGTGVALGKIAENAELFECRWDAKFDREISCVGSIKSDNKIEGNEISASQIGCEAVNCTDSVSADSISCNTLSINQTTIFDLIYPIGSIYMSVNEVSPSVLFGGEWEQLKDKFLLGAGDTYTNGATGGEATHTLTVDEMPGHNHGFTDYWSVAPQTTTGNKKVVAMVGDNEGSDNLSDKASTTNTGGGKPHNNMPPYLAVYMWKRIG